MHHFTLYSLEVFHQGIRDFLLIFLVIILFLKLFHELGRCKILTESLTWFILLYFGVLIHHCCSHESVIFTFSSYAWAWREIDEQKLFFLLFFWWKVLLEFWTKSKFICKSKANFKCGCEKISLCNNNYNCTSFSSSDCNFKSQRLNICFKRHFCKLFQWKLGSLCSFWHCNL